MRPIEYSQVLAVALMSRPGQRTQQFESGVAARDNWLHGLNRRSFSKLRLLRLMRIFIVTPAGRGSRNGNRNTAIRWAGLLRRLGHKVAIDTSWQMQSVDVLIALHARRSHESIAHYRQTYPSGRLILALTGTDLYRDIGHDPDAQASLRLADRMIVLQEEGLNGLSAPSRKKTRVIYQSAVPLARSQPLARTFEIAVIGHLRAEKDPFRTALSAHIFHRPPASNHSLGRAMSEMEAGHCV
jgi:hypothetical protein